MDDDYSEIKRYLIDDVPMLLAENEKAIYRKRIEKIVERLDVLEKNPYASL